MNSVELRTRILDILKDGASYGAAISEKLDVNCARVIGVLHDLEGEGLVEAAWTQNTFPERGDRPRRMYWRKS